MAQTNESQKIDSTVKKTKLSKLTKYQIDELYDLTEADIEYIYMDATETLIGGYYADFDGEVIFDEKTFLRINKEVLGNKDTYKETSSLDKLKANSKSNSKNKVYSDYEFYLYQNRGGLYELNSKGRLKHRLDSQKEYENAKARQRYAETIGKANAKKRAELEKAMRRKQQEFERKVTSNQKKIEELVEAKFQKLLGKDNHSSLKLKTTLKNKNIRLPKITIPEIPIQKNNYSGMVQNVVDTPRMFGGKKRGRPPRKMIRVKHLSPVKVAEQYLYDNLMNCYAAATFFQILVSNTPIDEDYEYDTIETIPVKRKIVKSTKNRGRELQNVNTAVANAVYERTIKRHRVHIADDISVRGDWILEFRGKIFKAFQTESADYSESVTSDYTFDESLFETKSSIKAIKTIAKILSEQTDGSDSKFNYRNLNPRWELLEYGGYKSLSKNVEKHKPVRAKYIHGTTKEGFVYQAPKGFLRLTEALYNSVVDSLEWQGTEQDFFDIARKKLDASKARSEIVKELQKYDPSIGTHTLDVMEVFK